MAILRSPKTYRIVSTLIALLYGYLFIALLYDPQGFLAGVGVEGTPSADFLARRAAMLMLGFAIITFCARNAPPAPARQAITLSIAVSMAGLCAMSGFEYARGFANAGILIPAAIEAIFALLHAALWLAHRGEATNPDTSALESR